MNIPEKISLAHLLVSALTLVSLVYGWKSYATGRDALRETREREADKELFLQAKTSLEWAYNALTDDGRHKPPRQSRINWLTAARHLLRQEELARRLKTEHYKLVFAEHEEYWRHRFYEALDHNQLVSPRYWGPASADANTEEIEPRSAFIVVQFSNWPDEQTDVIDRVDVKAALRDDGAALGGRAWRGLKAYLSERGDP